MADLKISQLTGATTPLAGTEVLPIVQSSSTKKVAVSDLTAGRAVSVASLTATTGDVAVSAGNLTIGSGPGKYIPRSGIMAGGFAIGDGSGWYYAWKDTAGNTLATLDDSGVYTFKGNFTQGTAAKGVNFTANTPAAGMTSQLLNWYEEGTWTATLSDGTNNATMSATTCRYVRIGRHITVSGYVSITSRGSMSGALRITGLPFTCANANSAYAGGPVTYASGLNIVAGQSVTVLPEINTTYLALYVWAGTGGTTPMQNTQWTDSGGIMFSATYSV